MRRILWTLLLCLFLPAIALAQEDEDGGGFLTRTIEGLLSGAGRDVNLIGFAGALSSEASFDRLTISDDQGVWLTVEDVTLVWSRLALLRGRLEVDKLTAARIDLPRLATPPEDAPLEIPDAEAEPFALPELPVSVNIKEVVVERLSIGEPVVGAAAELTLSATARLDDEAALIDLLADRVDGKTGRFGIKAGFERQTSQITVDVALSEEPGGLVARLLNLPDQPSVDLRIAGVGPLDDFAADIAMSTDAQERLAGQVSLRAQPGAADQTAPDRRILADLGGDLTALIAPEYRDFFGPDVSLTLDALQKAQGGLDVSAFALTSQAANIAGEVRLNSENWPSFIAVNGAIGSDTGAPVVLPGSDAGVSVQSVLLEVDFDHSRGDALSGGVEIAGLNHADITLDQARLGLDGTLQAAAGSVGQFLGDLTIITEGMVLADPALAEAVGDVVSGKVTVNYIEGQPIRLQDLALEGADYSLAGGVIVRGLGQGFPTRLDLTVQADDLARFAAVAGQPLGGAAAVSVAGSITPLSGIFDLQIDGTARDVTLDIPEADAVLAGETRLSLQAARDATGSFLRDLTLESPALSAAANAELRSADSSVTASARLNDLALVLPGRSGPVTLEATGTQSLAGWRVAVNAEAPYDTTLKIAGLATGPDADLQFDLSVPDLKPLVPEIDGALRAEGRLWQTEDGYRVDLAADGPFAARVDVEGLATGPGMDVDFDLSIPDVQPIVPGVEGGLAAQGRVWQGGAGYQVDVKADGPYDLTAVVEGLATGPEADLNFALSVPDVQPVVPSVSGPVAAQGRVWQTLKGYEVDVAATGPHAFEATVAGLATGAEAALNFDLGLPDLQPLVPSVSGPLKAAGKVWQTPEGYEIDVNAAGPYAATAAVTGLATGADADLSFDVALPDLKPLVPSVSGPVAAAGRVWQTPQGYQVDVAATGPAAAEAKVAGLASGANVDVNYTLAVPRVQAFVPAVAGALQSQGRIWQTDQGFNVDVTADGPYQAKLAASGLATGPDAAMRFAAALPNVAPLAPGINGPMSIDGSANRGANGWQVDTRLKGPSNAGAAAIGLVNDDGTLDLSLKGLVPLGLSQPFLAPRSLTGRADFDLAIKGAPELSSVTGRISTRGASFAAPNLRLAMTGIDASVTLANARADVAMTGNVNSGGQVQVQGGAGLDGNLPADLRIALRQVILTDPRLYSTLLNGDLAIAGPLAGGAQITGTINVGETLINVPSGLTGIGEIPDIAHVGAGSRVTETRARAGVIPDPESEEKASQGGGFGLDIAVRAPSRIFVRGRGLDAELGGALDLTGTTSRIISAGQFELVRGRIDILAKRFNLDEGIAQFQGDLVPYLRFVTSSTTKTGTARVILEGPADDPEITFESTPAAPQDEVLAQLLFGADLSDISPFQAVQLANAVSVLAGGKGIGLVGNLRKGFGLDDLDITTTDSGETAVRAGKYISEDIYTDITASANGESEISLNFDLTDSLKAKGTVEGDGDTALGIFFERDY